MSPISDFPNFVNLFSSTMKNNSLPKKTQGRRKIEIKKIENKAHLSVTFTKRRRGIFRKASELSVLCGAEIAILVQSPAVKSKIFAFGNSSVESVLSRFQTGENFDSSSAMAGTLKSKSKYDEALRRLEVEFLMEKIIKETNESGRNMDKVFWWDEVAFNGMELYELEEYVEALEGLRGKVLHRVEEMERKKFMSDSGAALSSNHDQRTGCNYEEDLRTPMSDSSAGLSSNHDLGSRCNYQEGLETLLSDSWAILSSNHDQGAECNFPDFQSLLYGGKNSVGGVRVKSQSLIPLAANVDSSSNHFMINSTDEDQVSEDIYVEDPTFFDGFDEEILQWKNVIRV